MKVTSILFSDYKVSDNDIKSVKESIEDMDSLFNAIKGVSGVGFLKMHNYSIDVLDFNSYPMFTVYVDERYQDTIVYRF